MPRKKKESTTGNPSHRPPILTESDHPKLKAIMRFKPRMVDAAAFFEVHPSTLEKYIKKIWGITYSEFRDQNMVSIRFKLNQAAIDKALGGDTAMLIFCLKNYCGWSDKGLDEVDNKQNITINL